jgi:hypothetical protein
MFFTQIEEAFAMRIATYPIFLIVYLLLVLAIPVAAEEPKTFEGIVVQENPWLVRSSERKELSFYTSAVPKNSPKFGRNDLIEVKYTVGTDGAIKVSKIDPLSVTLVGTITEIASDKSRFFVTVQQNKVNVSLLANKESQPLVTAMQPGDGVIVTYNKTNNEILSLDWQRKSLGRGVGWLSLFIAAALLWFAAMVFTGGHPSNLYLGADTRYSNSKFQTVLWFGAVISAYCVIVFQRIRVCGWSYIGGVGIPQNLLILSGISVLTFVGAKAITVGKGEGAKSDATAPKAGDLISDDLNRTDLGDFQMVVITGLAVILYAISIVNFLQSLEFRSFVTMPDVDTTLLALFGLSQAGYLGKKWAGEATPEQAKKAADDAATAVKGELAKVEEAKKTAEKNGADAKTAAVAVKGPKTAAEPELVKVKSAAKASRDAAKQAAAAVRTAETRVADIQKLADAWSKEPTTTQAFTSLLDSAQADLKKAKELATNADKAANGAEKEEKAASEAYEKLI